MSGEKLTITVRSGRGTVLYQFEGPRHEVLIPELAKLDPAQMERALADAKALRARKLMPSVAEQFSRALIPPRGKLTELPQGELSRLPRPPSVGPELDPPRPERLAVAVTFDRDDSRLLGVFLLEGDDVSAFRHAAEADFVRMNTSSTDWQRSCVNLLAGMPHLESAELWLGYPGEEACDDRRKRLGL